MVETALSVLASFYARSILSEETATHSRKGTLATIAALVVVAILGLGFVAYASMNPRLVTVTQLQYLTNTQNQFATVTAVSTVTSAFTETATTYTVTPNAITTIGYPYPAQGYFPGPNCGSYGCSPPSLGAFGSLCQTTGQNQTVSCSGYLSEPTEGCTELAIPYTNPDLLESTAYQFYTLRNTSSLPPAGSWITVTGQLGQGYTQGTNGGACPANYINVSTMSP